MNRLLGFACITLLGLSLAGCGGHQTTDPGTIIFARGADSQKLDPVDVDDGESMKALIQICEGLVRFKTGTTEIEPCLATSWTISPDGLTYTFKLRENVRFHDSTPLDATAAAFSFLRQMDKSHPAHLPNATFAYWNTMFSMVEAVETVGTMELRFRLRQPHAPFMASLAIPAASLISPKFIDQQHPVGTGPFRFVEWVPNERIVFAANPDYWEGPPASSRLILKVVPDSATRLIQLQTGQIHGMDGIDPNDLIVIQKDKSLQLLSTTGLNVCYLALNCEKPPLDNVLWRQRIAMAINKQDLLSAVYRGSAVPAKNPLPAVVLGYNAEIPDKPAAHIPALPALERPLRLEVMTNPRPYLPNPIRAAEMIKADLEKAGIPVQIVPNEWGSHLSRTSHGEHDMALLGWIADIADADNFLYVLLDKDAIIPGAAMNICFWKNDEYHDLMIAALCELDPEKRAALYRKAQEIIFTEAPMIPLAHAQSLVALRTNVHGLELLPNGDMRFRSVTVDP